MREQNSGKEEDKRWEPPPNVSAVNNTSWEKSGGLDNRGRDRLDHAGDVNNVSPRYDKATHVK